MMNCSLIRPENIEEGLKVLSKNKENIKVLAGGSELVNRIRAGKERPEMLLDASALCLEYIKEREDTLAIGAMTRLSLIENAGLLNKEPFSILSESAGQVGGWQIRNVATIGGNICTGNSSADMAVALLVLDAKLKLVSLRGERTVPIDEFFEAPRNVDIKDDEILTEIIINLYKGGIRWGTGFIKSGKRKSNFISVVNAAAVLGLDTETQKISSAKIAMGTVAPTPIRLYKTESFLKNKAVSPKVLSEAADIMEDEISPRDSLRATKEYRINVARTLFKRVIEESKGKALGGIARYDN